MAFPFTGLWLGIQSEIPLIMKSVLNAVLIHYLRVKVDMQNPYNAEYGSFDEILFNKTNSFFGGLSCQDLCVCPCTLNDSSKNILKVITNALNIRIVIWEDDMTTSHKEGPVDFPEYHVNETVPSQT